MGTTLFLIDCQNDFMDYTDYAALPVAGSVSDMLRIGDLLYDHGDKINKIVVTLDQHPHHHIAHAVMWVDDQNQHPLPFTTITYDDIIAKRWQASLLRNIAVQHKYVADVDNLGQPLTIWPQHCIIGSWGASLYAPLQQELKKWAKPDRHVEFFNKSGNWSTEQYSSFQSAIVRYDDPSTQFNQQLYDAIDDDLILVAGEALSHCVAATIRDAISEGKDIASRMVLLRDCTSPVDGCGEMADKFLADFTQAGGRVVKSTQFYETTEK